MDASIVSASISTVDTMDSKNSGNNETKVRRFKGRKKVEGER